MQVKQFVFSPPSHVAQVLSQITHKLSGLDFLYLFEGQEVEQVFPSKKNVSLHWEQLLALIVHLEQPLFDIIYIKR